MNLNQLVASDRLRPLLEGVVDAIKPSAVSTTSETGSSASLSITPSIKVTQQSPGVESVRKIVEALIIDGGGTKADAIADSLTIDGLGLYFVGAGSSRNDVISFDSDRTDAESPNLYLNAREGDDNIAVKTAPAPPPDQPTYASTPKVTIDAGDGRDKVRVTAGIIDQIDAGAGDDIVTSRADRTSMVDGGDGDDTLSVFGRDVGTVAGGSGNDNIIAYGDLVGAVSGGEGDDQIVVGSRNISFAEGIAKQSITAVSGGAGDDVIAIAGRAEVSFAKGDGKDQVTVGDTTMFDLQGFEAGELSIVTNDDGTLTIAGPLGDDGSVGDSITIESRTETLRYIFDEAAGKLTVFATEEAFAAADGETPATLQNAITFSDVNVSASEEPTELQIAEPQFIRLTGDIALDQSSTIEDQSDGTLITFAENTRQLKLLSDSGPLFVDVMSNRTLALFKTQEQLDAWQTSPTNPENRSAPPADSLMAILERINQRFV